MKTIETTVYEFNELNDAAKEKAREWYRRTNDEDNYFSESVIDDAKTCAGFMGIEFAMRSYKTMGGNSRQEPCVFWSGFSSQGDGACFDGEWRARNVKAGELQRHAPQDDELHRIAGEFERISKEFPNAAFSVRHSGHYSHKGCTSFDIEIMDNDGNEIDNSAAEKAHEDLIITARDFMQWIYRQLEKEYEYQNADEQIDEAITANDYTFTADGKRYG